MPPNNFYVREDDIIKSVGRQVPVGGASDLVATSELPIVWKIFSEEKVSEAQLDVMFRSRSQVKWIVSLFDPNILVYDPKAHSTQNPSHSLCRRK